MLREVKLWQKKKKTSLVLNFFYMHVYVYCIFKKEEQREESPCLAASALSFPFFSKRFVVTGPILSLTDE